MTQFYFSGVETETTDQYDLVFLNTCAVPPPVC